MKENIIFITIAGTAILYYYWHNKTRKIERFYYKTDKKLFVLLEVSVLLLTLSIGFNARYIVMDFLRRKFEAWKK